MNLKQFLKPSSERNLYYWVKPDWRKIVVFFIIFFIAFFILFFSTSYGEWWISIIKPPVVYIFFPFWVPRFLVETFNLYLTFSDAMFWFSIVFTVFFWYLVSCFIIWIYDKVKKKEVRPLEMFF